MAASYANLFMKYWEKDLLEISPSKPKIQFRFINDMFMI